MNPIAQPGPSELDHPLLMSTARMLIVVGVIVALGTGLYFYFKPEPAPTNVHLPAQPAPQVSRETTVPVAVNAPAQVYRPEVKRKLKLPAAVQANPKQHVVASSRTAPDERPHTITTILDTDTGEFATLDRAEPLPWIGVSTRTEVGVFYGLKSGEPALRVQAQQELLRVKALHLGAVASADVVRGDVDTYIGVGAWARW